MKTQIDNRKCVATIQIKIRMTLTLNRYNMNSKTVVVYMKSKLLKTYTIDKQITPITSVKVGQFYFIFKKFY